MRQSKVGYVGVVCRSGDTHTSKVTVILVVMS